MTTIRLADEGIVTALEVWLVEFDEPGPDGERLTGPATIRNAIARTGSQQQIQALRRIADERVTYPERWRSIPMPHRPPVEPPCPRRPPVRVRSRGAGYAALLLWSAIVWALLILVIVLLWD